MITRKPVKSSAVKSLGFKNGVLEVEYSSGGIYRLQGVTQAQYDGLHGAESVGRALNTLATFTREKPEGAAVFVKVEPEPEK